MKEFIILIKNITILDDLKYLIQKDIKNFDLIIDNPERKKSH